ncbi:hypothetical protein CDG81_10630 [Actinopolyspora erythraea]|uniref:3,4-dihydroxy-2-butanone-4-phosphate synthase n=1 Tax=Actinopolyspora erythraea TaxID=414996 RepID=A0A223RS01_9ACTN|nr:3,4-dihydroxy-2-butanone-4-phosphate synthase [Actinopolyspora erythraea]ASU78653.1 hypothetical protein CDG81_10630 [Actinopolyspora erythraea]
MSTSYAIGNSETVVLEALVALVAGRPVVVDTAGDGGHLVLAGSKASGSQLGWMIRHTSGFVLAATTAERLDALHIPPMFGYHSTTATSFAVSVDASEGTTTGISGHDRALTMRTLASPEGHPRDLIRPGHVVPVRTAEHGVLERAEAAEAGVDLVRLAGLSPVAAVCAMLDEHGGLLDSHESRRFAADHEVPVLSIADVMAHRFHHELFPARTVPR